MATVHFLLQGKGGAGKSLIASILYQYYMYLNIPVSAFDTDPVNATLFGFKDLPRVIPINIMDGAEVDTSRFDAMLESIVEMPEDHQVIVDNGASSFLALCNYLTTNDGFGIIRDSEHRLFIHTVINGSASMSETLSNLASVVANYESPVVVWLNDFHGQIEVDGRGIEDFEIFQECGDYIEAVIRLPKYDALTRKDMERLLTKKKSFESFIKSNEGLMARQRITKLWREIIENMQKTGVL